MRLGRKVPFSTRSSAKLMWSTSEMVLLLLSRMPCSSAASEMRSAACITCGVTLSSILRNLVCSSFCT